MLCILPSIVLVLCYSRLVTKENLFLKLVSGLLLLRERYCLFFFLQITSVAVGFFNFCELILASLAKLRYLLLNIPPDAF